MLGLAGLALIAPGSGGARSSAGGDGVLAFSRAGGIWLAHADGTGAHRLAAAAHSPDWSPDGTRIAFVSTRGGRESIATMRADGSGVRVLTRGPRDLSPDWSPDGRRLAFTRGGQVLTMRADGTGQRVLVRRVARWHEHTTPAWGRGVFLYASNRVGFFNTELYATPARRLTFTKGSDGVLGDDSMPALSPDGRRVAFTSNRTQDGEIWLMAPDGTRQKQLTHRRGDDFFPAWTDDGTAIAFAAIDTGWIMRVDVDGSGMRRLVRGVDPAFRPTR